MKISGNFFLYCLRYRPRLEKYSINVCKHFSVLSQGCCHDIVNLFMFGTTITFNSQELVFCRNIYFVLQSCLAIYHQNTIYFIIHFECKNISNVLHVFEHFNYFMIHVEFKNVSFFLARQVKLGKEWWLLMPLEKE